MSAKKQPEFVFFDGEIIPYKDANIHIMTPCVRYGAMVFEGIRGYWNEEEKEMYLFRLSDHSMRLIQSANMLRMEHQLSEEYISEANIKLLKALQLKEDLHIRQMVFVDGDGPLHAKGPVKMASVALPRGRKEGFDTGLHVSVSSWTRISDAMMPPRIKSAANYQNGRLGAMQAKLDGYDSTLFLDGQGKLTEAPGACVFVVRGSKIFTPTVTNSILESITRDSLIRISLEQLGVEVVERDIDRTELYVADEIFLCGSGAEVTPVVKVDHHPVGNGEIGDYTHSIRNHYLDITRGVNREYADWRTPVYK